MDLLTRKWIWSVTIALSIVVLVYFAHAHDLGRSKFQPKEQTLSQLPPVMLWAWERPEQLNFIDPDKVGVAFLAKTINLRSEQVLVRPRLQPLIVPPKARMLAVVRIETDTQLKPILSASQLDRTVSELISSVHHEGVLGLQIDFDAKTSERDFYRQLLISVRQELPKGMLLSMTALASWCTGDNWLNGLPVDEAVPMMFRLGVDQRRFVSRFQSGYQFPAQPCKASAGISIDEIISPPHVQRLYVFNPDPWSQTSLNRSLEAYYP